MQRKLSLKLTLAFALIAIGMIVVLFSNTGSKNGARISQVEVGENLTLTVGQNLGITYATDNDLRFLGKLPNSDCARFIEKQSDGPGLWAYKGHSFVFHAYEYEITELTEGAVTLKRIQ